MADFKAEFFSPEHSRLLEMKGRDARDFLHRLTTVNARFMTPHQGAPGFFLTAQGKVRAYFHLWCISDDHFLFELEAGQDGKWLEALTSTIEQMTFAEKFTVSPITHLKNGWVLFEKGSECPGQAQSVIQSGDSLFVLHHGDTDFGRNWISVWGTPEQVEAFAAEHQATPADLAKLDAYRISALTPSLDRELVFDVNPLEIGLKHAIADNKGCYPGQEVIEKIISLGSPAKRLALLQGQGAAPVAGEKTLTEEGVESGEVTSAHAENGSFVALALLRKNAAREGLALKFSQTPSKSTVAELAPYEN